MSERKPLGPALIGAFELKRMRVSDWSTIQDLGLEGWDLVTVSDGYAYMKRVCLFGRSPVQADTRCGTCRHFVSKRKKDDRVLGLCSKLGVMLNDMTETCDKYEDTV